MLTEVNASGNGFGYHGALAVRECLQKNNVLRKLDISDNRINWEGALVSAALPKCQGEDNSQSIFHPTDSLAWTRDQSDT